MSPEVKSLSVGIGVLAWPLVSCIFAELLGPWILSLGECLIEFRGGSEGPCRQTRPPYSRSEEPVWLVKARDWPLVQFMSTLFCPSCRPPICGSTPCRWWCGDRVPLPSLPGQSQAPHLTPFQFSGTQRSWSWMPPTTEPWSQSSLHQGVVLGENHGRVWAVSSSCGPRCVLDARLGSHLLFPHPRHPLYRVLAIP